MNRHYRGLALAIVFVLASAVAQAATYTWKTTSNLAGPYNWQDATNWNGGGFPSLPDDVAIFTATFPTPWAASTKISLGGTVTLGTLSRSGGGWYEITNGTLLFATTTGSAVISNRTPAYDSFTANVTFNTNTIITENQNNWGSSSYVIGLMIVGVVGSSGDFGLYKDGPGMLALINDANSFTGKITVANGWFFAKGATAGNWGVLGNPANTIVLGSPGARGGLMGYQSSVPFTRPIELAGVGGILRSPIPNVVSNVISGSGELVIANNDDVYFRGAADNTYSGGTRIYNRYTFAYNNARILGSGDVKIEYYGRLFLMNPAVNVDPAAKVLITSLGNGAIGPNIVGGILILGADSVPTIDTNSSGVIALGGPNHNLPTGPGQAAMSSGTNINNRFAVGAPQLGNGYMYYGDWSRTQNGTFTGGSLQPNLDGMYRFVSGESRLILDHTGDRVGVLTGTNGVEVFGMAAGPNFNDGNDFSGPLKVHVKARVVGYAWSSGVSSFGATNGPVEMKGGELWVQRADNAYNLAQKGTLSFESASMILMRNTSASYTTRFDVASMVRTNGGLLILNSLSGGLGGYNRITAVTPPAVTYGIVPPYFISDAWTDPNTLAFLNYVADVGFTNAPFTVNSLTGAVATSIASVTNVESVPSGGIEVYALKTKTNLLSNGSAEKIKIGSGGLILQGTTTNTAPIDFGASEGIIYLGGSSSAGWRHQLLGALSGTNGLAIGGDHTTSSYPAYLTIGADNSSSLTGTITINHGGVVLITSSSNLGPDSNLIVLNSGAGTYTERFGGLGAAATKSTNNHAIWLGSEGGRLPPIQPIGG